MNNKEFRNTHFARAIGYDKLLKELIGFLVSNRNVVAPVASFDWLLKVKPNLETPIYKIFTRMVESQYLQSNFATILNLDNKANIPSILAQKAYIIDTKSNSLFGSENPLKNFYELNDKVVINLSNIIRKTSRMPQVSDLNEFHSLYVKGFLSRTYADIDGWMPVQQLQFVIQSFALCMSSVIAVLENLNPLEHLQIASIFALYYSQLLIKENDDYKDPGIFYRCNSIGTPRELQEIVTIVNDKVSAPLTLDTVASLMGELGPVRLQKYDGNMLRRTCSILGANDDFITTQLAFEYPPYWIYLVLQSISGSKSLGPLSYKLKQFRLNDEANKFIKNVISDNTLFKI